MGGKAVGVSAHDKEGVLALRGVWRVLPAVTEYSNRYREGVICSCSKLGICHGGPRALGDRPQSGASIHHVVQDFSLHIASGAANGARKRRSAKLPSYSRTGRLRTKHTIHAINSSSAAASTGSA